MPVTPGTDPEPTVEKKLTIAKDATSQPANGQRYALGEQITYQIRATNDGNVTLTNITVTDALTGDVWIIPTLAPGASWEDTASYTVTEADVLAGSVQNVVTATGDNFDPAQPDKLPSAYNRVTVEEANGHLTIEKVTTSETPEDGYALGDTIEYRITATNDGNLTLTNITVTDDLTEGYWPIASLAPGESRVFTTSHTVTAADVQAQSVTNIATAAGTSPDPAQPNADVVPGQVTDTTSSGSDSGSGGGGGGGRTPSTPTPQPTTEIVDEEVPLAPIPNALNGEDHFAYVKGYPDETVRPEGNISRAETATMLYRLLTPVWRDIYFTDLNSFSDVEQSFWFNKAVSSMANGEYILGYPDGTFQGDNAITRAEFVTIMVRFLSDEYTGENPFSDISEHWAKDYILAAVGAGWIDGYPDETFRPDANITRAEAMKIINSVLHRGVDGSSHLGNFKNFPDNNDPGKWYYYEVIEACNDHDHEGSRPNENWTSNSVEYFYDIAKYEYP